MKALIYQKNGTLGIPRLIEKPMPVIQDSHDAIIRVRMSAICTSDLHILHGAVPSAKPGIILGHEFVGEVISVGGNVKNLNIGDRVAANCITFCGQCYFCKKGYVNNCINGGWKLGCQIDGGQAEYVRVPYARNCLTKIPDNVTYAQALLTGDILSSGYFGAELCEIEPGDTIAVIGAGPVGLCAMICAKLLGAGKVIAIDINDFRLKVAKSEKLADYILNPDKCNIVEEVCKLTENRGADGVIECAGTEETFETAWKIARPNSVIALAAMYEKPQTLPLPDMYGKNLVFKTGDVDAIHCKRLLDYIADGKIDTNFLISKVFPFDKIVEAYRIFEENTGNIFKIAIDMP